MVEILFIDAHKKNSKSVKTKGCMFVIYASLVSNERSSLSISFDFSFVRMVLLKNGRAARDKEKMNISCI